MPTPHPRPWHRGSVFGDGPRVPLDRERRARFRFLLNAHHRGGRLTRAAKDVGDALLRRLSAEGRCDPSHDTLAADAACDARTVRRATVSLRALGLMRWTTRLVRVGWRAEQTSNAYELVPAIATPPAEMRAPRCGGQSVRETLKVDISYCPEFTAAERQAAQTALAQRRAAVEARLLNSRLAGLAGAAS
jgi:hypothetical protein